MFFELVSVITNIEKIAVGVGVRDRQRLRKSYTRGAGGNSRVSPRCDSKMVLSAKLNYTGTRHTVSAREN